MTKNGLTLLLLPGQFGSYQMSASIIICNPAPIFLVESGVLASQPIFFILKLDPLLCDDSEQSKEVQFGRQIFRSALWRQKSCCNCCCCHFFVPEFIIIIYTHDRDYYCTAIQGCFLWNKIQEIVINCLLELRELYPTTTPFKKPFGHWMIIEKISDCYKMLKIMPTQFSNGHFFS